MAEIYQGVKFELTHKSGKIPKYKDLKLLKYWCKIFQENNFAPPYPGGSSGNLSFRYKAGSDKFIITASSTALGKNMSDKDFVFVTFCDIENNKVTAQGIKKPSSETLLHYAIYKNFPEINAVFHGHSPEILAAGNKKNIPTTKKEVPYGTVDVIKSVFEIIENNKFIIIKNHGFISIGKTMNEAGLEVLRF